MIRSSIRYLFLVFVAALCVACGASDTSHSGFMPLVVSTKAVTTLPQQVESSRIQRLTMVVDAASDYATVSVGYGDVVLLDELNIPTAGKQQVSALVRFADLGPVNLTLKALDADVTVHGLTLQPVQSVDWPVFDDISAMAGIDKAASIKYGGPTIADIDQDGDYDFIVNNHNAESSKLYWNNGDGTVSKHTKNLARWFMHDLHGTAAGDYDNDGDLDLVVTQGGGNGTNPSKANFYHNNQGTLVLTTGDVNIDRGGRGRGARWLDADLDGDLDLLLVNERGLRFEKPQHFFYENQGDATFTFRAVEGLQNMHPSRVLITDFNGDHIDDIVLFGPLSLWQGNGDFTYTDVTQQVPAEIAALKGVMAVADIDIDNDGDLDLYLARGKEFENGRGEAPSVDHDPMTKVFSIKPRGFKGVDTFEFTGAQSLKFYDYYHLSQGSFRGKEYPLFLGAAKQATVLASGDDFTLLAQDAQGWPEDIRENGMYFGYLGQGQWKAALVRNGDIFWGFKFSLHGVESVELGFEPENRNMADVLLRNDGGQFVDVSREWRIPLGGNALGVTRGDFNNDSYQDLFVYRWGRIGQRVSDVMLLNNGKGKFDVVTQHGANDVGGPGNGDMGQAFDFDLDGRVDLLNGSEGGEWSLYGNASQGGQHVLVDVGYAPESQIDAISALVTVTTAKHRYQQRVGSAGAIFSQSLLDIVHFGLGDETQIESIHVRWRNGETAQVTRPQIGSVVHLGLAKPTGPKISAIESSGINAGEAVVDAFLRIDNLDDIEGKTHRIGDSIDVSVSYHAGSGNNVIISDQGGIRFWLRHFRSKWIPVKDVVLTDATVLGTESGTAQMTLPLTDKLPTAALPEGHFYQLRVSFTSSSGEMLDQVVYPLALVE